MYKMRALYDVIVVGAGIEGSATAYNLAKTGQQTLLLEQFPLPHSRGSSHGQSRITRMAYGPLDYYTRMMKESFQLTRELQEECGEQILVDCGVLCVGIEGENFVRGSHECLRRHNLPHEVFGVTEQRKRYPNMVFPDNFQFVLDKSGGLLKADKMLRAFQAQFVKNGGVLKDGEPMVNLHPGTTATVVTTLGTYRAKSVVLALGPWAAKFLPKIGVSIPLEPLKITVCYWKDRLGPDTFNMRNFPMILAEQAIGKYDIYGLPAYEYPGLVKICLHTGPTIDPDKRDDVNNEESLNTIKQIIATHFPTLEKDPKIVETCIYTNTPDTNPVLDYHPAWKNVVIAAGFSGHGFKLSPIVGKILAQMAVGETPDYDMTPFKLDRFFKNKL